MYDKTLVSIEINKRDQYIQLGVDVEVRNTTCFSLFILVYNLDIRVSSGTNEHELHTLPDLPSLKEYNVAVHLPAAFHAKSLWKSPTPNF